MSLCEAFPFSTSSLAAGLMVMSRRCLVVAILAARVRSCSHRSSLCLSLAVLQSRLSRLSRLRGTTHGDRPTQDPGERDSLNLVRQGAKGAGRLYEQATGSGAPSTVMAPMSRWEGIFQFPSVAPRRIVDIGALGIVRKEQLSVQVSSNWAATGAG